jgi:hypothetical protein
MVEIELPRAVLGERTQLWHCSPSHPVGRRSPSPEGGQAGGRLEGTG